jgi:UDP-N-acetylglucosamine acyltransferase
LSLSGTGARSGPGPGPGIHPTALIDPGARLAPGVEVGPYTVIGAEVEIGPGTRIGPHAVLRGPTRIGRDNRIFQFASVGEDPQDMKYGGEPTRLEIGDRNRIREYVTIHRGTVQDHSVTSIGSDNLFMAYTHVAHDCRIGDHVIMANAASLGGHVEIQDWAILGGFTIVHQFCRIGAHSFCAMGSVLTKDLPTYVTVGGHPALPHGINSEGLRRRGFSEQAIAAIKRAYRALYLGNLKLDEALERLRELAATVPEVAPLADFVAERNRGIVR